MRWRAGLLVALAIALVAWLFQGRDHERHTRVRGEPSHATRESPPARVQQAEPAEAPSNRRDESVAIEEAHLIETVSFEPAEPCVGSDVLVRVQLIDPHVKTVIGGHVGNPGVLRFHRDGVHDVSVLARGWDETYERRIDRVNVRTCSEQPRLGARIVSRLVGERHYVLGLDPAPSGPVDWDFGDATWGRGARVEHRYASRADRPYSTYLVKAVYQGPSGVETAMSTVMHVEPAGVAARTPFPIIEQQGERFVPWEPQTELRTMRRFTNALDVPTELVAAELQGYPCDGDDPVVVELDADRILSTAVLEARSTTDATMTIPADVFAVPVCQLLVRLTGFAEDRIATSAIALDTGIPDERQPIEDPELLRVIAALAVQGRGSAPITAEEIAAFRALEDG